MSNATIEKSAAGLRGRVTLSGVASRRRNKPEAHVQVLPTGVLPPARDKVPGHKRLAAPSSSAGGSKTGRKANDGMAANESVPSAHEIRDVAGQTPYGSPIKDARPSRSKTPKANGSLLPIVALPSDESGDEGQEANVQLSTAASVPPDPIALIGQLQRQRIDVIKSQVRLENQVRSRFRLAMGWKFDWTAHNEKDAEALGKNAKDNAKICADAADLVKTLFSLAEKCYGTTGPAQINGLIETCEDIPDQYRAMAIAMSAYAVTFYMSARGFDSYRAELEKSMSGLARSLPVWPWVESVKGFGAMGLAIVVGEAGDLANYANPGKLWKRLGLAPFDGLAASSWKRSTAPRKLSAEEWIGIGYNQRRRSASWTIADSLLRQPGPYADAYRARRVYECEKHPEFITGKTNAKTGNPQVTKQCDLRARRYAEKRLIKHLWQAWRRQAIQD